MTTNDNQASKQTTYSIYASLREDINSGWVWVNIPKFRQRAVVSIYNPVNRKKVYCEVLRIDDNFLSFYNPKDHSKDQGRIQIIKDNPTLVINEWYRKMLGDLNTQTECNLCIEEAENPWGKFHSCIQHPQVVVRVATWLGLISIGLGVISLIISFGFGFISLLISIISLT